MLDSLIALIRPYLAHELGYASPNLQIDRILTATHDGVERTRPDDPFASRCRTSQEPSLSLLRVHKPPSTLVKDFPFMSTHGVWCYSHKRTGMIRTTCVLCEYSPAILIPAIDSSPRRPPNSIFPRRAYSAGNDGDISELTRPWNSKPF